MIKEVHDFRKAINEYLSSPASTGLVEARADLDRLIEGTMSRLTLRYSKYKDMTIAHNAARRVYLILTKLMDTMYMHEEHKAHCRHIYPLLVQFELFYEADLASDTPISLYGTYLLQQETQEKLAEIIPLLQQKLIPEPFIAELSYAVDSLFDPKRLPQLLYYHRNYLLRFLNALSELAHRTGTKSWTFRFVILLINYNFNYLGFFNRFQERLLLRIAEIAQPEKIRQYLADKKRQLHYSTYDESLAFDPLRRPLLEDLQHLVEHQIEHVESHLASSESAALLTTLNSNELSLIFRYAYAHGILNYETKRAAAQAFSQYIKSKTDKHISYKTLEKFDKKDLEPDSFAVTRLLKKILDHLDKDFNT